MATWSIGSKASHAAKWAAIALRRNEHLRSIFVELAEMPPRAAIAELDRRGVPTPMGFDKWSRMELSRIRELFGINIRFTLADRGKCISRAKAGPRNAWLKEIVPIIEKNILVCRITSMHGIANRLNFLGIPTQRGKEWDRARVREVLRQIGFLKRFQKGLWPTP
jgi:hypothetical protein